MDRVERALIRIERAVERGAMHQSGNDQARDQHLRQKVAAAIAELDHIIESANRG